MKYINVMERKTYKSVYDYEVHIDYKSGNKHLKDECGFDDPNDAMDYVKSRFSMFITSECGCDINCKIYRLNEDATAYVVMWNMYSSLDA